MTIRSSWHCCCGQFKTPQRERTCTACSIVAYEQTPIGLQGVIPGAEVTAADEKMVAERRWKAPLIAKDRLFRAPDGLRTKPAKLQQPCDHGLFGDEHLQLDLVEMLQEPTND